LVMSFKGCTEIRSVALLATFCATHHPSVKILVHRDRDFLSNQEAVDFVERPLSTLSNVSVFVTDGCDLESNFLEPTHIAGVTGLEVSEAEAVLTRVALENHNSIVSRFNDKRQALHKQFGRLGTLASTD